MSELFSNVVKIYDTNIPFAIKAAETTSKGKSIIAYDKNSKVTEAYSLFAKEVLKDNERERRKNALSQDRWFLYNTRRKKGVIHPVIVRPKKDGTYEMISGHRRKRACELAGIKEIPAIVRKITDEDAIIYMVDSNKQRETILPSEKAFAYKMKLEAMKRKAGRPKLENSSPMATNKNIDTGREIGEDVGESRDNVYRYIRLTELIPELLQLVDDDKMIKSLEGIIFRVPEYGEANNRKETAIATSKQDSIKEAFLNWIWE